MQTIVMVHMYMLYFNKKYINVDKRNIWMHNMKRKEPTEKQSATKRTQTTKNRMSMRVFSNAIDQPIARHVHSILTIVLECLFIAVLDHGLKKTEKLHN